MAQWRIESNTSGMDLGMYEAESPEDALDVMARCAGYRDQAHATEVTGDDGSHLIVTLIE